jgi:4-amino-4-deoxy-L-arabinose transferase-like glycosyltransferase
MLAACSLVGFAAIPQRLRPSRARLRLPASLSIGTLLAGWSMWIAGNVSTALCVPLFVILVAVALRHARAWARDVGVVARELGCLMRANVLATAMLFVTLLLLVPQLLLPVVDSDGLRYHLALPKLFAMTGHIFFNQWDVTGAFPQTAEMLFLAGWKLGGGETAKLIHFGFFLASLATLALAVHRGRRSRPAAFLATFLYAVTPVVIAPAGAAFIDHLSAFHVLTGALLAFAGASPLLIGAVLGAAFATKFTAAPAVLGLVVYTAIRAQRAWPRALLLMAIPGLIAFAPFAIRNVTHTGDPIFPLGYALLHKPVPGVPSALVDYTKQFHSQVPGPTAIAWDFDPAVVQRDEVAGWHHLLGLFAIAVAVSMRSTRRWLALVIPFLLVALAYHPPTRYLMPMFAALAAFEASALTLIKRRVLATSLGILVALPALLGTTILLLTQFRPADYVRGHASRDAYLAATVPGYRAAAFVNAQPAGGRVMALDFPAPYYFDRPFLAEGLMMEPPLQLWLARQRAPQLLATLRREQIRYILITPGYGGGTLQSMLPLAQSREQFQEIAKLRAQLRLLTSLDGVDVYQVP